MRQKKVHFIGIGGSGISGVAKLAENLGYEISGCDLEAQTAYSKNIFQGHDPKHLDGVDMVVTTPAAFFQAQENAEITEARNRGILITWQEFLGKRLLTGKKLICIAGTHGKSTTTAMVGKILIDNGFDPIVVLGATVPEWGGTSRYGDGEYAVIEADEFYDNFLNYSPDIAVINNIEFDHPDYFKNFEQVKDSFEKFKSNLIGRKLLITEKDSLNKNFNLKVIGEHNQKNANMAFLVGKALGIEDLKIIKSLEEFRGIGRRMELIVDRAGIKVFDDYAHHPTAVKTTVDGLRHEFRNNRIIVVDEPHGFARTKALLDEYEDVFNGADKVYVGPIFKARDSVDDSVTPKLVVEKSKHPNAKGFNSFEEILAEIKKDIKEGDIILIMGAGKSYLWAREIANLLPQKFSNLTTMRVGGVIKKYIQIEKKEDIPQMVELAEKENLPLFILGGGSDILVNDKEFDGIVVKYTADKIMVDGEEIVADAGSSWDDVVKVAVESNLAGIECLSGIPGTSGAAPIQNIGAYGQELKDTFVSLEAYDIIKKEFVTFTNSDCKFGYRESIFKNKDHWQRYLVTSIRMKLIKDGVPKTEYESLVNYLKDRQIENPSLGEVRDAVLKIRSGKFEDPKVVGNAGSFFKNPIVTVKEKERIEKEYPDVKYFAFGDGFKIAAGWLIEKAGWKGKSYKTAAVSPNHALIIINPGKANARDVFDLSEKIIEDIYSKFGIKLEREVQLINF